MSILKLVYTLNMKLVSCLLLSTLLLNPKAYSQTDFGRFFTPVPKKVSYVDDILRDNTSGDKVRVTFEKTDIINCLYIDEVLPFKKLELWDLSDSCQKYMDQLRTQAISIKGNLLYIEINHKKCSFKNLLGKVYRCIAK